MKGLYQEALKNKGANVQNYIIAARISQGYDESNALSPNERADIVTRWKCIKGNVKKKKNVGEEQIELVHKFMQQKKAKRHDAMGRWNHRFKRPEARPAFPPNMSNGSSYEELPASSTPGATNAGTTRNLPPLGHASTFPRTHTASSSHSTLPLSQTTTMSEDEAEREALESALAASMSESTPAHRSSEEEDEHLAAAIRASVTEFQRPQGDQANDEASLQRAITASLEEASKHGASEEDQKILEEVLRKSTLETQHARAHDSDNEWDSDADTEEDEEFQRIIAESKELAHLQQQHPADYSTHTEGQESGVVGGEGGDDEEDFKKALEASEKAERERQAELEKQKSEEEIVMEYVKKQSLAEEEHRRRIQQGRVGGESSSSGAGN